MLFSNVILFHSCYFCPPIRRKISYFKTSSLQIASYLSHSCERMFNYKNDSLLYSWQYMDPSGPAILGAHVLELPRYWDRGFDSHKRRSYLSACCFV